MESKEEKIERLRLVYEKAAAEWLAASAAYRPSPDGDPRFDRAYEALEKALEAYFNANASAPRS